MKTRVWQVFLSLLPASWSAEPHEKAGKKRRKLKNTTEVK